MVNPYETWWTDRCWARDRKSEVWWWLSIVSIYYDFMNILIMSLLKCHWLCTCFLGAISPIKQKLISIKFSTHINAIQKLYLTPLIFLWRHRVSRDSVSKGQISKVNICKREWTIDFNFGVYLSWEEVYPKIAIIWKWCHLMNIDEVMTFSPFLYMWAHGEN